MYKCLIIADDLTGANASISLLHNFNITTLLQLNDKELYSNYDAISCSTESRSISSKEAYKIVFDVTKKYMDDDVVIYNKRIDSTMRGNIGAEVDAMLDALGDDRMAFLSPAYPSAGRTVVGGYLLVNGVLVEETEMAYDSKNPIKSSDIQLLVSKQTKRKICLLDINIIKKGRDYITQFIKDKYNEGYRIIVCDMINQDHVNSICNAVIDSKIKFIVCDPSPLTAKMSELLMNISESNISNNRKVLCAIGSISHTTALQVKTICQYRNVGLVRFRPENFIDSSLCDDEIKNVSEEIISKFNEFNTCIMVSENLYRDKPLDFDEIALISKTDIEYLSNLINEKLALAIERILKAVKVDALYTSGGDTTIKICAQLNSYSLDIKHPVLPLVVYAKLNGGEYKGLDLITKGGGAGDSETLIKCVDFLSYR
ncbi:four-carbon acid sugar kinase family protein [Brachyspira pilosicoli]|uniref:four-carbon acid sugar kinase family protein n=1 Tax=Brachyspira pilosicoli TaxID=52584 RepID=UPI003007B611